MSGNPSCKVYIGNLDERVEERVLYEIMIQAGPLADLYMPRDNQTNRHKGYGFATYTTRESAVYAVKLFSGLLRLHHKLLRIEMVGKDKLEQVEDGTGVSHSDAQDKSLHPSSSRKVSRGLSKSWRPPKPPSRAPSSANKSPKVVQKGHCKVSSPRTKLYNNKSKHARPRGSSPLELPMWKKLRRSAIL